MRSKQRMIDLAPATRPNSTNVSSPLRPSAPLSAVARCPAYPWRRVALQAAPPTRSATAQADDMFRHARLALTTPRRRRVGALRTHAGARAGPQGTLDPERTARLVRLDKLRGAGEERTSSDCMKGVRGMSALVISFQIPLNSRPRTKEGSAMSRSPKMSKGRVMRRPRNERGVISP